MRILVTGGAGFIGSHLSEALLRQDHEVTIIDELNDFYSPDLKAENLEILRRAGRVTFVQADICDQAAVTQVFQKARPQAVVHLAARAGVRPSLDDPLLYERVNVHGTMVLLEACRRSNVAKFVFASSSSVYGLANQVPFREDDLATLPISPYAATKLAGEKLCFTYSHLFGISATCLRFFTVYGPRQRPDLAIRKFTEMIDAGRPIPVFGDGKTGRDYTFVDDIVGGILRAIEYASPYEIFNLGNSSPVMLDEMIATIEQALGQTASIRRLPDQPGDVPITYADISKAKRLLGYQPCTPFRAGIQRFIEWHVDRKAGRKLAACTA